MFGGSGPKITTVFDANVKGVQEGATTAAGALGNIGKAALAAAGAFAAVKIGQFVGDSIKAASDLAESASKVDVVFGDSADTIQNWAKTAATHIGLSRNEALDAAGAFGNMFTQVGISTDQTAKMSTTMAGLAADMASFHNADITEVIQAQQSAFRGEYDAVQRFVPTINAAAVEQRALADTHKASTKQLTAADKAMASYELMVEGAGAATGDFARTSNGMANQQRIMSAQWKDAQATLGQALLPVLTKLAQVITGQIIPAFTAFLGFIGDNIAWVGPLVAAITAVIVVVKAWAIAQAILNASLWSNPVLLIVAGIIALVAAIVVAYQKVDWFRAAVDAMARGAVAAFNFLWDIIKTVFNWIRDHWQLLLAILGGPIGQAAVLIIRYWDQISAAARWLYDRVSGPFKALAGFFVGYFVAQINIMRTIVSAQWNALQAAARVVSSGVQAVFSVVSRFFTGVLAPAIRTAVNMIQGIWNGLVSSARTAASWVNSAFQGVVNFFRGIVGSISNALSGVYNAIISPFQRALDWLGQIPDKMRSIIDRIPGAGAIGNALGALNPFSASASMLPTSAAVASMMPRGAGFAGAVGGSNAGRPSLLVSPNYTLNIYPRRASVDDVRSGFRRLEAQSRGY